MELPKGVDMQSDNACVCFVRVGCCRFGSILDSILESFWGQVRYYTPFWSPGWPKQAHKRVARFLTPMTFAAEGMTFAISGPTFAILGMTFAEGVTFAT